MHWVRSMEGGQGGLAPLDFENFSKKGCFLNFEWEKRKFHHFCNVRPLETCPSPGKNPSDAHGQEQTDSQKYVVFQIFTSMC